MQTHVCFPEISLYANRHLDGKLACTGLPEVPSFMLHIIDFVSLLGHPD
jgi:hypothetical protein